MEKKVERGNFLQLFQNWVRLKKFLGCIFIGLPIWFVIGILVTFSPEFAVALNINGKIIAGDAVMFAYIGLAVGDLASGFLSQALRSRKRVVSIYASLTFIFILLFLFTPFKSVNAFYAICFLLGVGIGYWALFVTIAAEQFGTNLRSTVTTSVPNIIRGTVIPITFGFKYLRDEVGVINGALIIGIVTIVVAFIALRAVDETFGRDLNFEEE